MNVVKFKNTPLTDIPQKMRELASRIESGEVCANQAILVLDNDQEEKEIYMWGHIGRTYEIAGILFSAAQDLVK